MPGLVIQLMIALVQAFGPTLAEKFAEILGHHRAMQPAERRASQKDFQGFVDEQFEKAKAGASAEDVVGAFRHYAAEMRMKTGCDPGDVSCLLRSPLQPLPEL